MVELNNYRKDVSQYGFAVIERVFTEGEISNITNVIGQADTTKATFRKTNDLFAIRQFLKEIPEVIPLVFTERLNTIIRAMSGDDYFVVKSIYFDKPAESNWFVAYHQDLTISVDKKVEMEGFGPWTVKEKQYAVQPPSDILENNFTIRMHLDDTNDKNGALRVIPKSHLKRDSES
jgi:ectoine hydroxylase-related dioxygenase (phytanoyl-CoA dioxygenase family)